ncbi:MAG: DUF1996 domain-containing protein [Acidimicrobiia bacterium]
MSHPKRGGLHTAISRTRVQFLIMAGILMVLAASSFPAAIAGAATGVGSFRVACIPSHDGVFDPIVFPGQLPAGHHHEFYGSTETGPSSVPGSLIGSSTTCSDSADSSGYWHPTVFFDGVRTPATLASIYYTQRTTKKPVADVQSWPAGLRVVAGDGHAQTPQSDFIVWWDCDGVDMERQPTAPTCPTSSRGLEANVRFPDCWDGANLDSADHKSHMSYSVNDGSGVFRCDAAHPVPLPYLHMIIRWDGQYPAGESVTISSGSTLTFHADFMNGWNQVRLESLIDQCIVTQIECGRIDSGSQPNPAVASPPATVTTASPTAATATTAPDHTTGVTTEATTMTAANHHTGDVTTPTTAHSHMTSAPATPASATTEVGAVAAEGPDSNPPMTADAANVTASDASGPGTREIGARVGRSNTVGATAAVLGVVIVGAGILALASLGYSLLRRPPAASGD